MGPIRRGVREAGLALITLGVVVFLFVAYQLFGTGIAEANSQSGLAKQFKQDVATVAPPAATPTATTVPSPPGGAVDHLVIPKIGLDKYVVEGTGENDLRKGPGHYTGTAYPGHNGNTAIAGHRTTYGAPFFRLDEMASGDPIYLTDLTGHTWVYRVSQAPVVVSPTDTAVLDATAFPQLTLTTCNPRFSASSRLIVFARLDPQATVPNQPTPATTPSTTAPAVTTPPPTAAPVLAADSLGDGRTGAEIPTVLYGLLVVGMWAGVRLWINRTRRWHRLLAYVAGIAVCLVPLWFCFENAVLLLPQNF